MMQGGDLQRKTQHPAALFEDSPDLNQRVPGLQMQGTYPRYQPEHQLYQHTLGVGSLGSHTYQTPQQQFPPQINNFTQQPMTGYHPGTAPMRPNQSEESGGGGGVNTEDFGEDQIDDMREGENDIEYIIMNLYSKMKNLENKYIDLANFYKQELVKSSGTKRGTNEEDNPLYGGQLLPRSAVNNTGGIYGLMSPQKSLDKFLEAEQSVIPLFSYDIQHGKESTLRPSDRNLASERQIINDLIEEKRRLEDDLKQMISLRGSVGPSQTISSHMQQSPPKNYQKVSEFKTHVPSQEQLHFLKQQLTEALGDVIENLDNTQKKELHYLSNKQNEMYQMASKYNFQPQIKNESLGLWFDAKTKISSLMSDFKVFVLSKQKQIESNLGGSQITSDRGEASNFVSLKEQLELMNRGGAQNATANNKIIEEFKKELSGLKKKHEQHHKNLQKMKNQMKLKEGLVREEQGKLNQIIRDLKQSFNNQEDASRRLLSGDKSQNNILMSPFERKIATYQKSAERRKVTNERSGSRGRPTGASQMTNTGTNFYYRGADLQNPQIMPINPNQNPDQDIYELRNMKQKVKAFEIQFSEFSNKLILKNQDIQEFERQADSNVLDQQKYIQQVESLINYHTQNTKVNEQREKSKPRLNELTSSPIASINYNTGNKEHERKIAELQRNNEQIYQELRKANEKYLNQRVENNKLKDEVQILQTAMEEAQIQIRKLHNSSQVEQTLQPSRSKQKITLKTRPSRYDGSQEPTNGDNQQRQHSNTSNHLTRENEELKKRVQELEKECFSLTYYQQELQRRGGVPGLIDPYSRAMNQENGELKNKIEQLCLQVQKFMLAMRRLQRAVNNKDKDIQNLKADFEKNKKLLDIMVKEIKEKEEMSRAGGNISGLTQNQPIHHSMMMHRDPRFGNDSQEHLTSTSVGGIQPLRNKSQAPKDLSQSTGFSNRTPQQYPITQRPSGYNGEDLNNSNSMLPPKKGVIRPKQQFQQQQQQTPIQPLHLAFDPSTPQPFNQTSGSYQQQLASESQANDQQENFNQLLEEVKLMHEERDDLRKQIQDLKSKCEEETVGRNEAEGQVQQKTVKLNKIGVQMKQQSEKTLKLEKMLNEYKEALQNLENVENPNQYAIRQVKIDLLYKERDLAKLSEPSDKTAFIAFGATSVPIQTVLSGETVEKAKVDQLKANVMDQIQQQEKEFTNQLKDLSSRLSEKEEDLNYVKKLLMDKLREIETSFIELSQDMSESEVVQIEASRRYQQNQQKQLRQSQISQQQQQKAHQAHQDLEKSIELIIVEGGLGKAKGEEEYNEQAVKEVYQLNEQLSEENSELRQIMKQLQKDLNKQEELQIYKAQFDDIQEINEKLEQEVHDLQNELDNHKRSSSQLKQQLDKTKQDFADLQKSKDKAIGTYQAQLNELESQNQETSTELRQEQEQRIFFESEYHKQEKTLKLLKNEKQKAENERDKLAIKENDLEKQIESLKEEIQYVQSLRQGDFSSDNLVVPDTTDASSSGLTQADQEEQDKITDNPKEAANHFLRLLKATKKEFQIMSNSRDKLQQKHEELKEKFDTLKLESRSNVEEIMNMETKIFDLTSQNERLQNEIEKAKGDYKVEEEMIRKEVEDYFRERMNYKDSEIDQMTQKVARVSQTNIELTNKCSRLESNIQELCQENETLQNSLQSLEMELEMTKVNNERDIEQLQQQRTEEQKHIDEEIKSVQEQKTLLEHKLAKKREKLNQERQRINSEVETLRANSQTGVEQVTSDLIKAHEKKIKEKEQEFQSKQSEELEQLQNRLHEEHDSQLKRKDKERILIVKLQLHLKKCLEQELHEAIQENQEKQSEIEMFKEQYDTDLKELQTLKEKEMQLLEEKLKKESFESEKKIKKERSLVQVLQLKAREVILKELENEKVQRIHEQQEAKKHIDHLISQKEQEVEQLSLKNQEKIDEIQHQLQQQSKQEKKEIKLKLNEQLTTLQQESQKQLTHKQQEIERLKNDQEELVKSLSQQQDQQTKDLLNQKEKEKEQLKIELEEMKQELEYNFKKDLEEKDKQSKMMLAMQEKVRKDIESKLEDSVSQLEQAQLEREQELSQLKHDQQIALQNIKGKSKEEQDKIKNELESLQKQKQKQIEEKDQEIAKFKEEQELVLQNIHEQKQEELEKLQHQISFLEGQVKDQEQYMEKLEQSNQLQEQEISQVKQYNTNLKQQLQQSKQSETQQIQQLESQLNDLQSQNHELHSKYNELFNQFNELQETNDFLNAQHQDLNKNYSEKESEQEQLKKKQINELKELEYQKNEELQNLRNRLEQDYKEMVQKKEQERTLLEKMKEKIREELTEQINVKEQEKLSIMDKIKHIENDIQDKKEEIKVKENKIDVLSSTLEKERKERLNKENEDKQIQHSLQLTIDDQSIQIKTLKQDLLILKQTQSESENQQISDLSNQLSTIQQKCEKQTQENKKYLHEIEQLNGQLKNKVKEIENLEIDLEAFSKDMEEERQSVQEDKHKNDEAFKKVTEQLEVVNKDKKDIDMQLKLKESLIKKIQEQVEETEGNLKAKEVELQDEVDRRQKEKKKVLDLESQLKTLKQQHEDEMDHLQQENSNLKQQMEQLKKQKVSDSNKGELNQSIDDIESRIGEFNVQLSQLKKQNKELEKQKQLNDSLIDNAEQEAGSEIIGDVNSDALQFCKRVKYLDQAWILISKQDHYYWVNQSKIPIDKLQKINIEEIEQNYGLMEGKLLEIKDQLKQIQKHKSMPLNADYASQKGLEIENQELKDQNNEYHMQNLAYQQSTLQLKSRINELNDMIFGLADSDKSHENISKIVDLHKKKEELSSKLIYQIEISQKLEFENDQLKKQIQESEYSFAKGGKSFAQMKPENFDLNTSSIDQKMDEDLATADIPVNVNNPKVMREKVDKLETELEEFHKLHAAIEDQNKSLKGEIQQLKVSQSNTSSQQQAEAQEILENIKHMKNLFIKFLEKVPIMTGGGEELLPVILSMMMLSKDEQANLQKVRQQIVQQKPPPEAKKGVMGGLFGKKK